MTEEDRFATLKEAIDDLDKTDWPEYIAQTFDRRTATLIRAEMVMWCVPATTVLSTHLVRGYCSSCGQPLRVIMPDIMDKDWRLKLFPRCATCEANAHPGYNTSGDSSDDDPSQQNSVRILEDKG